MMVSMSGSVATCLSLQMSTTAVFVVVFFSVMYLYVVSDVVIVVGHVLGLVATLPITSVVGERLASNELVPPTVVGTEKGRHGSGDGAPKLQVRSHSCSRNVSTSAQPAVMRRFSPAVQSPSPVHA